ncbi:MAG: hypothetical protein ACRDUA_21480, partial [Micromonosporaceae bacterium]
MPWVAVRGLVGPMAASGWSNMALSVVPLPCWARGVIPVGAVQVPVVPLAPVIMSRRSPARDALIDGAVTEVPPAVKPLPGGSIGW